MSINKPKISVIMGIYNCEGTLRESLDSVMAQTFQDFELILCDDASTDRTYDIAKEYRDRYPGKVILLRNEENHRLAYCLNRCLEAASGEYAARMDGDDISVPDRFEKQAAFLDEHPELAVVGSFYQRFDGDKLMDTVEIPTCPTKQTMRYSIPFNHATVMMRKEVYDALGGYTVSPLTVRCEDLDLWFRFFKAGYKGESLPCVLYMVREDMNAVRRRTVKSRWQIFKVTSRGFDLLGFPRYYKIKPFIVFLAKAAIPFRLQMAYRNYLARKDGKKLHCESEK